MTFHNFSQGYVICKCILLNIITFSVLGPEDVNDDYVLGAHLFCVHNKRDKSDFNNFFV